MCQLTFLPSLTLSLLINNFKSVERRRRKKSSKIIEGKSAHESAANQPQRVQLGEGRIGSLVFLFILKKVTGRSIFIFMFL